MLSRIILLVALLAALTAVEGKKCFPVCGRNEVRSECVVACPQTCQEPDREPCPTFACGGPSCVCQEGYVREKLGGRCIRRDECACGKNEVPVKCDNPCQATCSNPKPDPCYTLWCGGPDCVCAEGFIRDEKKNCIPIDSCPH